MDEMLNEGAGVRPAVTLPVEVYTPERIAQFLLTNAVGAEDYQQARDEVVALGLDPDAVDHVRPATV